MFSCKAIGEVQGKEFLMVDTEYTLFLKRYTTGIQA